MANNLARILIVDDEAALMKALCDTLRDNSYETFGFTSGKTALDSFEPGKFDLLLADLMMPEMDGITLLQQLQKIDPNLVGIIMTGEGTIATAVEAMKIGAFEYILKPFKMTSILPILSRALAIRTLRIENAELQERIKERTLELEASNKELEAFSYSVSHDLKAPLRAVDGFSKILLDKYSAELPADAKRLIGNVITNTKQMAQLIEDLLNLSRTGRQQLLVYPLDMKSLVEETLLMVKKDHSDRNVVVKVGELPSCNGDRSLLKQVLFNLLNNAFKFTRHIPEALVEVGGRIQDGKSLYFVIDNGVGFDMKHAGKIFDVFQRLHSANQFEGTGVGLSIVKRVIERHGGKIWTESELNKGAKFYFTLPC
jgi:signal transduction histidine kinase